MENIENALGRLRGWVEDEEFRGYDPYDTLKSPLPFSAFGRWGPILAIQIQKRNPVNVRSLLGIAKGLNPKGLGLFLYAYSVLYERDRDESFLAVARSLFARLLELRSPGYSGDAWGYDFDWASPAKYLPAYTPSVVVTGFVGRGIFRYWEATGDPRALEVARSACDFILDDLPVTETPDGVCISYTPVMKDCCYNASLLGAELLARVYSETREDRLLATATRAVDFALAHQYEDGHWNYSIDPETGRERSQIDFHQGFVLDSLDAYARYSGLGADRHADALRRGAAYYRRKQFTEDGRALWRLPREWPADIHHQAQGILTFSTLRDLEPSYDEFARTIARWTIRHMQAEDGYFYYRVGRLFKNRIAYMRWGQAWMMVALTSISSRRQTRSPSVSTAVSTPRDRAHDGR